MIGHTKIIPTLALSLAALLVCSCKDTAEEKSADGSIPPSDKPTTETSSTALVATDSEPVAPETGGELDLEKDSLKFGFIKLTDCAPIVIAKEKGFFDAEGLSVEVIAQPNWKQLLDNVITGELDGAHMLSGQPIAATIGFGTKAHIVTPYTLDLNGNGITVSNDIWAGMQENDEKLQSETPPHPITAVSLKPLVDEAKDSGKKLPMGMVFPVSTHNYEIRYWLAAAGIHPGMYTTTDLKGFTDGDIELSTTPPPQMPATLESGKNVAYCVGEPWNQQAVAKGIGVPVTTNYDIWKNNPEKVFGVTKAWADENPNTLIAITKALIKAGKWLDETDASGKLINREEACRILSQKNYVGADFDIIKNSMTGFFYFQKSDKREMPDFNVFFKYKASYPYYSDGIWFLTQMRRWGQITESKPAEWYAETAKSVYLPEVYMKAAKLLIEEGSLTADEIPSDDFDGYKPATTEFIDGIEYDGKKPLEYLKAHTIGNKS